MLLASLEMAMKLPLLPSARVGSEAMNFLAPAMEMAPAGSSMARESSKQSRTAAQISSLLTWRASGGRVGGEWGASGRVWG